VDLALWILALVVAAMVMFALEIVTPMFGLLAALGVAALAGAVWIGFNIDSTVGLLMIIACIVLTPAYLVAAVKLLPRTPLGRRLFLAKARRGSADATPEAGQHKELIGKTGTAETSLRPSGAVRIDGKRIIALSEAGTISRGEKVKVVRSEGFNIVVRKQET